MDIELTTRCALVLSVLAAAWFDLQRRSIPNFVTASGAVVGLALAAGPGGRTLAGNFLIASAALLLGLPLFARGALGGGDVKLMVAIAALIGPAGFVLAMLIAALVGGVMAVASAARRRVLLPLLLDARDSVLYLLTAGRSGALSPPVRGVRLTIPYGIALGVGAVFAVWSG